MALKFNFQDATRKLSMKNNPNPRKGNKKIKTKKQYASPPYRKLFDNSLCKQKNK